MSGSLPISSSPAMRWTQRLCGASRARVREQLRELERLTLDELGFVGESELTSGKNYSVSSSLPMPSRQVWWRSITLRRQTAETPERVERLALLRQKIGRDFSGLIDAAIADEREETRASRRACPEPSVAPAMAGGWPVDPCSTRGRRARLLAVPQHQEPDRATPFGHAANRERRSRPPHRASWPGRACASCGKLQWHGRGSRAAARGR